jgi:hypothetical protein
MAPVKYEYEVKPELGVYDEASRDYAGDIAGPCLEIQGALLIPCRLRFLLRI